MASPFHSDALWSIIALLIADGYATTVRRQATRAGLRRADGDPVRNTDQYPVGDASARDGIRVQYHLLAPSAGLAGGSREMAARELLRRSRAADRIDRSRACMNNTSLAAKKGITK